MKRPKTFYVTPEITVDIEMERNYLLDSSAGVSDYENQFSDDVQW